jgi:Tfp pilus assembly protein PilW
MKKKGSNKLGFSLIETIIASAIMILALGAFSVLYINFSKSYSRQQTEISIGDSARAVAKEIQSAALQANHIIASYTFSGTLYSTDQHTVVLEIPSIDGSGNIVSGKHDYAVFYQTGKNLNKIFEADAASSRSSSQSQLSDAVSTLTFTYNNPDLSLASKIDTNLQMQTISRGQTVSYDLHQEIYLRNL